MELIIHIRVEIFGTQRDMGYLKESFFSLGIIMTSLSHRGFKDFLITQIVHIIWIFIIKMLNTSKITFMTTHC